MKNKKIPIRRCVGCMESKPKKELIRIVNTEDGLQLDVSGKAKGRGVYLCPDSSCFAKARKKRAIGRSLGINISEESADRLFEELVTYEQKQD